MKLSIIKLVLAGVIMSISSTILALPNISGNWKCRSHDPITKQNVVASGEIKKMGHTYSLINWKDEGSNDLRSGRALHYAKMKNSLAVMFWSNEHSEDVGFGLYQIKSKNKIVGMWTMKNGKVTAEETCERINT